MKLASFRKHPNGTWEYRIRYKDRSTGKYKEKSKRGFKTKKSSIGSLPGGNGIGVLRIL
ncbi:Arm DNA-binding domain-containing protein [Parageobacillus toebii]|uniref:Arm DNA-binding domain-containing protein n=1 Tax=Parageobacillus toebii TaxID=153151 RepID=UPI001F48FD03|nr:Arm DNA-binding domain-containing protein [Parageobacillus toebii]